MPRANQGEVEYHYQDHDTDVVDESPPVQNTWYEVFDAEDVRLIWCIILQTNDETAAKNVEVRWTTDGNVYLEALSLAHNSIVYIYRNYAPSTAGTDGLANSATRVNAADDVDKRGLSFKVEVRMTGVPGTNQRLVCYCVRETQVVT